MKARTSLKEEVYNKLKTSIINGELGPGEKLSEMELSHSLNVSRTPIREAFRQLQTEDFITVVSNRGAFVSKLPTEKISEIYNVISLLEGYSAELAAKFCSRSKVMQLQSLQTELIQCASAKEYREYMERNTVFHRFIAEMSGNETLTRTIAELRTKVFRYRFISVTIPGFLDRYALDHERIVDAISSGNAGKARKYMRDHVQFVKEVLVSFLKEQQGQ